MIIRRFIMLQCVVVCCCVLLQCQMMLGHMLLCEREYVRMTIHRLNQIAVCRSVLQCVIVCCIVHA